MNIYDIAKKTKVSIATVSRALNPETRSRVAQATLEKIDSVVRDCNYTPSLAAKHLSRASYQTIGVLFPHHQGIFFEPYYSQVLAGVADGILNSHYHLKVIMLKCEKPRWDSYNFKAGEGIDALVVTHWHAFFSNKKVLENLGLPLAILSDPEAVRGAFFMSGDHRAGGWMVAEYLYSLGHRRFGILTGPADSIDSKLRVEGFTSFLKQKGIRLKPEQMACGEFQEQKAAEITGSFLKKAGKITALFCCNDAMAFGAIAQMKKLGLRCPKDISVVGYDDDPGAATANPPLTSVRVPVYELARQGVRELVASLDRSGRDKKSEALQGRRLLPVQFALRASAGPLA